MKQLCKSLLALRCFPRSHTEAQHQWHQKHSSKNSNLKLMMVTTKLQVQSSCSCLRGESVHLFQCISDFHWALRLSALSLQMASQLAALTLSLPELCCRGTRSHPPPGPLCQPAGAGLLTPPTLPGTFTPAREVAPHLWSLIKAVTPQSLSLRLTCTWSHRSTIKLFDQDWCVVQVS